MPSYAFFCPTNLNVIQIGDSLNNVQEQCGFGTLSEVKQDNVAIPQEWAYYKKLNANDAGTIKLSFIINSNKIININVNGISVSRTALCGAQITVGQSSDQLKASCGDPTILSASSADKSSTPQGPPQQKLSFSEAPQSELIFENGKLIKINR